VLVSYFHRLDKVWTWALVVAITFNIFYVPYSLALQVEISGFLFILEGYAFLVYVLDIYFRSRMAFNSEFDIEVDKQAVLEFYIQQRFIFDLLAVIPLDYILKALDINQTVVASIRVLRLVKLHRIYEIVALVRKHSQIKIPLFTLFLFFCFFLAFGHFMACIYILVGRIDWGTRFDGKSLYQDLTDRPFLDFQPIEDMLVMPKYAQFFYFGFCTASSIVYGDIVPYTFLEQLLVLLGTFAARVFLAFLFAETTSYVSSIHQSYSQHVQKISNTVTWMKHWNFPKVLISRVSKYYELQWANFKGIDEESIVNDLP